MVLKFYNIRSDETVIADSEPKIAALLSNSDRSPNITQGQDFGWRLAPEIVVELESILADEPLQERIAARFKVGLEDLRETDLLTWIAMKSDENSAPVADAGDYSDSYSEKIKALKIKAPKLTPEDEAEVESIADLEKRVELEERLAAARATPPAQTTPPAPIQTTTTTTTKSK